MARVITIEVGNKFIKICELNYAKKKEITVYHAITEDIPTDACVDGNIRNVAAITGVIHTVLKSEKIVTKDVTFIINSTKVASKEVVLPNVKKEKMRELIEANASEYFPVKIDNYALSFTVLETIVEDKVKNARVLVYAVPEDIVKNYYDLAKALKLNVKAVEYSGNATWQLMKMQIDDKPSMVLQIGMNSTTIGIMDKNTLKIQRTIPYGKLLLVNSVVEQKNIRFDVALELIQDMEIIKYHLEDDEITGSLAPLVNNLKRVLEYYVSKNSDHPIQKMYVIGDGANIQGIDKLFYNETNIETSVLTDFKNVKAYYLTKRETAILRSYLVNIGAGVAPVNFMLKEVAKQEKEKSDTVVYMFVFLAAIAAAVAVTVIPTIQNLKLNAKKEKLETEITEMQHFENVVKEYYRAADSYKDMAFYYISTMNNNEWTLSFLGKLEEITPKDITYNSISTIDGKAKLDGLCSTKTSVAELVVQLKQLGNVTNVYAPTVSEDTDESGATKVSFTIDVDYVMDVVEELVTFTEEAKQAAEQGDASTQEGTEQTGTEQTGTQQTE